MLAEGTRRLEGLDLGLTLDVIPFIFFQTFLQRLHITRRHHLLQTLTLLHLLPSNPPPLSLSVSLPWEKREKNFKTKRIELMVFQEIWQGPKVVE
ncbi:hypothetical protein OIU77_023731 [Salix suchowensis]|uniref:Uncharacterized protein n=1 Tax=Salix suchowensis TaxID=1278906 RepID=A0ABQ9C4Y3_9ROSI|nr:hypothetical protein OIU77_023731 [Salix suchowensis]